ncbi:MAG TPA: dihydrolipoamide acetyltransferase family protein [Steroidobacteraceae bacterium]|jgi:2-oxoisovalerate dehydrogenase E2 component (dihydrolipoyl transacylase)
MGQYSFKLPDVGEGTAEAEIAAWRVKVGDRVEEDQPLVDMMTDKATVELTSPVAGIVQSVAAQAGEKAAVGSVLVVLEVEGGDESSAPAAKPLSVPSQSAAPKPAPKAVAPVREQPTTSAASSSQTNERVEPASAAHVTHLSAVASVRPARASASPAVRRRAEELGVKLQFVQGSGPAGRINHSDLDTYLANGPAASGATPAAGYAKRSGFEEVPVIGLRRQIAERMQLAKRQIPHFSYVEEVDVTELEDLRAHLNATKTADQPKLTLLPFLMRAMVRVLPQFPQINATYDDEAGIVRRHAPVHIGMAAQTPRGLLVAVVRHAEARDLWNTAAEISRLAIAARDGKATREELTGSTITLTSLGPLGGIVTTPVINRPEVAIVGPNKIVERAIVRDGQIVVRKMMNLSSSFDHRVVDGADAAEFIQKVRAVLEHPATLFIP